MNTLRDRDLDRERDLSDYRQPRDYDREYDRGPNRGPDRSGSRDQDREISLGTGTILGIFFALALLCAVFFGFGYSMGRKSAQPTSTADATPSTSFFGGIKPSPGSPLNSAARPFTPAASANNSNSQPASSDPATEEPSFAPKQTAAPIVRSAPAVIVDSAPAPVVRQSAPKAAAAPTSAPATEAPMPQVDSNGTAIVQVAAVSHQEDADLLLSALKNRGYAVFIRQEPQDHLLHVQVGPFATKKDAEAMRQRLLADGYNAIVK